MRGKRLSTAATALRATIRPRPTYMANVPPAQQAGNQDEGHPITNEARNWSYLIPRSAASRLEYGPHLNNPATTWTPASGIVFAASPAASDRGSSIHRVISSTGSKRSVNQRGDSELSSEEVQNGPRHEQPRNIKPKVKRNRSGIGDTSWTTNSHNSSEIGSGTFLASTRTWSVRRDESSSSYYSVHSTVATRQFSSRNNYDGGDPTWLPDMMATDRDDQASGLERTSSLEDSFKSNDEEMTQELDEEEEEPHKPLVYHIPTEILEPALKSVETDSPTPWSYSLYKSPSGKFVPVHYCRRLHQAEETAKKFVGEKVLGFDLEWNIDPYAKRNIKRNVSLIQLASESRIALFHVALFYGESIDDLLPPTLKVIMEDPTVVKCGVAIAADCTRVRTNLGCEAKGLIELSHLHKLVKYSVSKPQDVNRRLVKLQDIVCEHLGLPLPKGEVRTSSWEKELNMEQLRYAASDAYCAVHLYNVLEGKRKALKPRPPRPYFAEERKAIRVPISSDKEVVKSTVTDDTEEDLELDDAVNTTGSGQPMEYSTDSQDTAVSQLSSATQSLSIQTASPPLTRSKRVKQTWTPPSPPPDPTEVVEANAWIASHFAIASSGASMSNMAAEPGPESTDDTDLPSRSSSPLRKSIPTHLRAYHIWHIQRRTVPEIASLLRPVPLQNATVANYILQAVHNDNLPFDEDRMVALGESITFAPLGLRLSKVVGKYLKKT